MTEETARDALSSLARRILLYLVRHPDAKDTVDGINEFWLADSPVHYGRTEVYKALEDLCASKHWLNRSKAGAAVTLYGLNKTRLVEIRRFLQSVDEGK